MKKIIIAVMLIAIIACTAAMFTACTPADYNVGIVQHVQHVALDQTNKGFRDKLTELLAADGKTVKFKNNNAGGDVSANTTAAQTLVNQRVDMIFAIATPSAQAVLSEIKNTQIPMVFSAVTSATEADLVNDMVAGTTDLNDIAKQIDLMLELVPNADKFGVMYTTSEPNSIIQRDIAKKYMESKGIEYVDGGISETDDVQNVFKRFQSQGVDCVYIPTDNKLAAAPDTVHSFNMSTQAKLPVVCGESGMNDKCGIATYGVDYYAIGVRAGEMAYEIITGKKTPKEVGYEDPSAFEISINENIAKELGFTIPQSVLDKKNK